MLYRQTQHLRTMVHGSNRGNPMRGPCAQYKSHMIQSQGVVNVAGGFQVSTMNRIEGSTKDPDNPQTPTPCNASLSRRISRFKLLAYMTVSDNDKFLGSQSFQAHRSARMQFISADTDLGAKPVLEAIGEPCRSVDHH